jgi:hypothetical protein
VEAHIRAQLGLAADETDEVIASKVLRSQYCRDYFMKKDFNSNMRAKAIDPMYTRAHRDVDSVLAAVRP